MPRAVAAEVSSSENQVFASAASTWELAIKAALGKVDVDIEELLRAVDATGFLELPVKIRHTVRVKDLPPHHRDPFDRLLIAQAREEGLTIVTRDPEFERYDVATMWT